MNVLLWIKDLVKAHFHIHKQEHVEDDGPKCAYTQDARNLIKDIQDHSKHKKVLWH